MAEIEDCRGDACTDGEHAVTDNFAENIVILSRKKDIRGIDVMRTAY